MATRFVCLGNELACDDGVGIRIGRILRSLRLPSDASVELRGLLGFDLLDTLRQADALVMVDAIRTGRAPGSCEVLELSDPALEAKRSVSCHGMGLAEMLGIARRLMPDRLPRRISIVGVEVAVIDRFGLALSEPVRRALPDAVEAALRVIMAPGELIAEGRREAERRCNWDPTPAEAVAG